MRALEYHMAARMSRDLYSRYTVMWAARDALTPFLEKFGEEKTKGIAKFLGDLNGYEGT